MEPDKSNQPLFNAPFQNPLPPSPVVSPQPEPDRSSSAPPKKIVIIAGVAFLVLLIIIMIVVAATSSKPKPAQTKKANTAPGQISSEAGAATSGSVQVIDGSISEDIGGLNEEKDFSGNKLGEKSLEL